MNALGRRGAGMSLILIAILVWNLVMTVLGLWQSYWWAGLFGNFFLIVLLGEQIGQRKSRCHHSRSFAEGKIRF